MDGDKNNKKGYDKIRDQILELCKLAQGNITTIVWCKSQIKREMTALQDLGKKLIDLKANPLLQIHKDEKEILVPLIDGVVQKVDRKKKELHITAPDGLIELYLG